MDLGATARQAFLHVTVPQALPGIVAAALVGFALSMDEFIVTFLVTGHDVTLPLFIYSSLRYSITPELNALSTVMLGSSFFLCAVAAVVLRGWGIVQRRRRRMWPGAGEDRADAIADAPLHRR
jgi:spermidine/putrescine transport system permease protein